MISFLPDGADMEDILIKAAIVVAVGLATFSSFPGTAQQNAPAQQQETMPPVAPTATPQSPTQQPPSDAQLSPAASQLKPVTGQLVDKLDSKSARQGDNVVVKTDQNLTISEGTEIPKGSKLVGHITNVQARGDGKENSQIAIQFDRAELKGGRTLPIESVIQSVEPAGDSGAMSGYSNPTAVDPASASASNSMTPQSSSGMNSANQSANAGAASQGMNQSAMDNRPSTTPNSSPESQTQGQSANVPAPGSIVARNGNVAIHTTAIPGVLLANDIHGLPFSNASGMFLGARRDVHLDGGTRITLTVAMAPQGAGSGMSR